MATDAFALNYLRGYSEALLLPVQQLLAGVEHELAHLKEREHDKRSMRCARTSSPRTTSLNSTPGCG